MHTRGRQTHGTINTCGFGTTHAHAGQIGWRSLGSGCHGNHPCTRGADEALEALNLPEQEPPMHTRGRRVNGKDYLAHYGTTHAHAGQTYKFSVSSRGESNHPCTRGADLRDLVQERKHDEPPMHTRGRHLLTRYNAHMSAKLYSVACIMQ